MRVQRQQSWVFYAMMQESSGAKPTGPDAQAILMEFFSMPHQSSKVVAGCRCQQCCGALTAHRRTNLAKNSMTKAFLRHVTPTLQLRLLLLYFFTSNAGQLHSVIGSNDRWISS